MPGTARLPANWGAYERRVYHQWSVGRAPRTGRPVLLATRTRSHGSTGEMVHCVAFHISQFTLFTLHKRTGLPRKRKYVATQILFNELAVFATIFMNELISGTISR